MCVEGANFGCALFEGGYVAVGRGLFLVSIGLARRWPLVAQAGPAPWRLGKPEMVTSEIRSTNNRYTPANIS